MESLRMTLLRGVCQIPAYVALREGFFRERGLEVDVDIAPTAWAVPSRLLEGDCHFGVIPWTRVAAASAQGEPLVLVCGSGHEEAAIVVRNDVAVEDVQRVAVPQQGGIKDLTAMALMGELGWDAAEKVRQPSGDGAILSLVGQGAEAASMVEPYATTMCEVGIGRVVKRTGDVWPGAPGCSLTTTAEMISDSADTVRRVVAAFVDGARFTREDPDEAAHIAAEFIGVSQRFIREALRNNMPDVLALKNREAMGSIIDLMLELGYLQASPNGYLDLRFLEEAVQAGDV